MRPWFNSAKRRDPQDRQQVPDLSWRYSYDIAAAPGTKLLGYPVWVQGDNTPACPACSKKMRLMLTCASSEDVRNPLWAPAPRRAKPKLYDNPSGQSWGDWSNAYLFYCTNKHPLKIISVVQSS